MRTLFLRATTMLAVLIAALGSAAPAFAQNIAPTDVCISIDEAHDTLSPPDRVAARLLLAKQFELAGWRVIGDGCTNAYLLSHLKLGYTITVTLAGPARRLEGTARGLDDLVPLYSQMVRAIVTGRTMEGMNVVDRTNVTREQAVPPRRVASDSYGYTRIGGGNRDAGFGFGHRGAIESMALDVSFLNFTHQIGSSSSYYGDSGGSAMWSLIKVECLRYTENKGNNSLYFGGGASYGGGSISDPNSWRSWNGFGFQGEGTVGYEFGRASTLRIFIQGDVTIPFYELKMSGGSSRYAPSFGISVGFGWQRSGR